MEAIGLLVKLEARPGKEADAEAFLKSAQPLALDEKATLKWYAIKLGPGKFGIFDTFANEAGRNAHLTGDIAKALGAAGQRTICRSSAGGKSGGPCKHTLKRLSARFPESYEPHSLARLSHEQKENHMSQTAGSLKQQKYDASVARVDMKLEVATHSRVGRRSCKGVLHKARVAARRRHRYGK